jgi:hypothetical protein
VLGDEESPPFVYTVGLAAFRHPEPILFATPPQATGWGGVRNGAALYRLPRGGEP